MSECAVMSGAIPSDGVVELLRVVESHRTTGELRFSAERVQGAVRLDAGQLAFDQEDRDDGQDVVELLLALRGGSFDLVQFLPELPVSTGTQTTREGSLAIHAPADLMNFCERAGLTGVLSLELDGQRARALYDRGELTVMALDGSDGTAVAVDDVSVVFGWERGLFRIEAHASAPSLASENLASSSSSITEPSGPVVLPEWLTGRPPEARHVRIVELPLSQILDEAAQRRPVSIPPQPAPVMLTPRARTLPPIDGRVRVIFLGQGGEMLIRREDVASRPPMRDDLRVTPIDPLSNLRSARLSSPRASAPESSERSARTEVDPEEIPRLAIFAIITVLVLGLIGFVLTLVDVS